MANPVFRGFTENDIGDMVDIIARARANDPHERRMTLDEGREYTLLDPDFDMNGAWFAVVDNEAVGFGSALVEKTRLEAGKDDAWIDVDVVPEHEGKGVEQALLDKALDYLRFRNVGKAMTRSLATDEKKRAFLLSNSFTEAHRIYTLVRRGRDGLGDVPVPSPYKLERWKLPECSDAQLSAATEAFNDSFADHINFAPELPERFINLRDCKEDPHVVTVVLRGDEIAGLALSEYSLEYNKAKGLNVGWVVILGVRPRFRGVGLGKVLLADGIEWVLENGADTVCLGVFAENEKALTLYRSFGFDKEKESIIYTRSLRT